ncbi:protein NYNRIN-like [Camponotus floridanus]|uniref:protein NYNRIN-like n=1 Tax=Camponotus floridanus TaxID=104421 RepID=UPI000DC691F2|nr:protein NYNRIN-like [Camponotus floridanus]
MGPFPPSKSGNAYILVVQDLFTKWIECCPLRKATGKKIRELLTELIVNRWGAPRVLLTDNGTEFINRELQAFAEEHGITHTTVPPYHPQANPVERVNRVIKTMITAFLESDHREWDLHLTEFRFAYNTAYHTSLQATPAFLNFGREPQPINTVRGRHEQAVEVAETNPANWKERMERIKALREWIIENLEAAHEKQSRYYNLRRRDQRFAIGERVLKRQHILSSAAQNISAKLATKFHGPFTIAKILSPVVYELRDDAGRSLGKGINEKREREATMSRRFLEQYRDIFEAVDEARPGFWTALAEEARRIMESRTTTRGAIVRDPGPFPGPA